MQTPEDLSECRRAMADRYTALSNVRGLLQATTTLLPIVAIWAGLWALGRQRDDLDPVAFYGLGAALTALMTLFLLRVFVLMHECGHGTLCRAPALNRGLGFLFGVLAGMPQAVWSRNHHYHHVTNGNWSRYRGPLAVIAVDEYLAMSAAQQRRYRRARRIWAAPLGGLFYLIVTPRLTWVRGSFCLARHALRGKIASPSASLPSILSDFAALQCASLQDYGHMFWNNVVLLALGAALAWLVGPALFFACYLVSLSVAGAGAIILFAVQHNFEHSYASGDEGWSRDRGVLEGTSFLILPAWLNWFTADIAYHHVHHLCARVPNYRLADCHHEQARHFATVRRITLSQIPAALQFILWDPRAGRLVSVAELVQPATP